MHDGEREGVNPHSVVIRPPIGVRGTDHKPELKMILRRLQSLVCPGCSFICHTVHVIVYSVHAGLRGSLFCTTDT